VKELPSLRSIFVAHREGDKEHLYEASLSRIWQHVSQGAETGFGIVTSYRGSKTPSENKRDFRRLKGLVRGMGLGFIEVKGHWRECQDPDINYPECPEDQLVDAVERALFIVGINQSQATSLGSEFEQDAVIYAGPETAGSIELFFSGGDSVSLGEFKAQTIGQAYTELLRSRARAPRTFKFEGFSWPVQSWVEALIDQEITRVIR
jgi:hypothetical protein